jgi:hypothetical protein
MKIGNLIMFVLMAVFFGAYQLHFKDRWFNSDKPKIQKEFTSTVKRFISEYNSAESNGNEVKMTNLRKERRNKIEYVLPTKQGVVNWIGEVKAISNSGIFNSQDDNIVLIVELLNSNIQIGSWNNGSSDLDYNSQIKRDSNMGQVVQGLKKGDLIMFSGNFYEDEQDYIKEKSITEKGSMTEPEYVFKFTSLSKY